MYIEESGGLKMFRLVSIFIECFSSIIFIIPAIIILQYTMYKQYNFNKLFMTIIFAVYSMAIFTTTGLPTAYTLKVDFKINLIPLADIVNNPAEYMKNTILNIILFVPMGFLLPAIWKEYCSIKKTLFMGPAVSIIIELLQIFTFRLTDIDDLITNTTGTFLGYYIGKIFSFQLPWKISADTKNNFIKNEPVIILIIIFLIGFFLKSFVSNAMWDIVLESSLWEHIK